MAQRKNRNQNEEAVMDQETEVMDQDQATPDEVVETTPAQDALLVMFNSKKADRREEVSFFDLPKSSQQAIIRYGAQRFINDKLGGAELGQEEAAEKFDQILKQLREGWTDRRGTGGGSQSLSPLEKKINELAKDQIKGALKQKGIPMKQVPKDKLNELIAGLVAKNRDQLETQAKRLLDIEAESLNLGGLDLDI